MEVNIRKANLNDIEAIVLLSKELGYDPQISEIENKLHKLNLSLVEEVFVAEYENVIGWMHISFVEPLESSPFVEIRGIVVAHEHRKKGIGTRLIHTAEEWAKQKDCKKIRIRTNIKRTETRKYYRNLNYISKKTQEVFEKEL